VKRRIHEDLPSPARKNTDALNLRTALASSADVCFLLASEWSSRAQNLAVGWFTTDGGGSHSGDSASLRHRTPKRWRVVWGCLVPAPAFGLRRRSLRSRRFRFVRASEPIVTGRKPRPTQPKAVTTSTMLDSKCKPLPKEKAGSHLTIRQFKGKSGVTSYNSTIGSLVSSEPVPRGPESTAVPNVGRCSPPPPRSAILPLAPVPPASGRMRPQCFPGAWRQTFPHHRLDLFLITSPQLPPCACL
jgi:hypothetical protein